MYHNEKKLSEQAYDMIKSDICSGKIVPGEILSIKYLAKKLSMSRTPVREAVYRLESESFCEIKSGIGVYVKGLSSQDVKNLYAIRVEMEVLAASTAIHHMKEEKLDALNAGFLLLKEQLSRNQRIDLKMYADLDRKLHRMIVEECENNYVQLVMDIIYSNIERYQRYTCEDTADLVERTEQHLRIVEFLRKKDHERVSVELRENIGSGRDILLPASGI